MINIVPCDDRVEHRFRMLRAQIEEAAEDAVNQGVFIDVYTCSGEPFCDKSNVRDAGPEVQQTCTRCETYRVAPDGRVYFTTRGRA